MIEVPERALSVRQPYAWAIVEKRKPLENRDWRPPQSIIGKVIAIHASRKSLSVDEQQDFEVEMLDMGFKDEDLPPCAPPAYVYGGIIGLARVKGFVDPAGARTLPRDAYRWFRGRYGWLLTDVVKLSETIDCKGELGLFKLKNHVRAALRSVLETQRDGGLRS